jgi:hypothetical protein
VRLRLLTRNIRVELRAHFAKWLAVLDGHDAGIQRRAAAAGAGARGGRLAAEVEAEAAMLVALVGSAREIAASRVRGGCSGSIHRERDITYSANRCVDDVEMRRQSESTQERLYLDTSIV